MAEQTLEDFNKEGILRNLISAEEHSLGTSIGSGQDTWCLQKHMKFSGFGHHYLELLQLTEKSNPEMHERLKEFGTKWRGMIDDKDYEASKIRDLRNEFREIIEDPTLSQSKKECGVCALDRRKAGLSALQANNTASSKNTWVWVVGGLVVAGIIIYAIAKKR